MKSVIYARTRYIVDMDRNPELLYLRSGLLDTISLQFPFAQFSDVCDGLGELWCETDVDDRTLELMRTFAIGFVACVKAAVARANLVSNAARAAGTGQ